MPTTVSSIEIGTLGFGSVNNYPPTHWRYMGQRNGAHVLEHVKPASQSVPYPDQFVSREQAERLMAKGYVAPRFFVAAQEHQHGTYVVAENKGHASIEAAIEAGRALPGAPVFLVVPNDGQLSQTGRFLDIAVYNSYTGR